ncbi:divalent-cation tolerance protein CutA [Oscillatoria sp. FACHB-1406]|uniref:divalent-cation tolerance protein CutA n=1 Tax=Oscillatoria sp. FACHB-1406 TaxID=2692846 RepID=UPI0016846CE4|nr:divalent-cation tolerance protein CutA [Oscillatoria sp. FACHB-1406]MBD2578237.1 divalent-cation tolerance protein CutA [Oscillatoria sp. FACHB-1406]
MLSNLSQESNADSYCVVLVTAASQQEAEAIASALLSARLAACVSMAPIHSMYVWKGEVNADEEWQLTIKTRLACFAALEAKVRELHSYEVPEIIALPIVAGSQPYLDWIKNEL